MLKQEIHKTTSRLRKFHEDFANTIMKDISSGKPIIAAQMAIGLGHTHALTFVLRELWKIRKFRRIIFIGPTISCISEMDHLIREDGFLLENGKHDELLHIPTSRNQVKQFLDAGHRYGITLINSQKLVNYEISLDKDDFLVSLDLPNASVNSIIRPLIDSGQFGHIFFFDSVLPALVREIVPNLSFSYEIPDAIEDGFLVQPKYREIAVPHSEFVGIVEMNWSPVYFDEALESIFNDLGVYWNDLLNSLKAFVVCDTREQADKVYKLLTNRDVFIGREITLIENVNSEVLSKVQESKGDEIFVCTKFLESSMIVHGVTDILLLTHSKSVSRLIRILRSVLIPNPDNERGPIIYDAAGNQLLFEKIFASAGSEEETQSTDTPKVSDDDDDDETFNINSARLKPVGDSVSHVDQLNREYIVDALEGLVRHKSTDIKYKPFVFGLFGPWGTGKSTVLNLLKKRFEKNKEFVFIDYNAWQQEHSESAIAALANSIANQLYESKGTLTKMLMAMKYHLHLKKDSVSISVVILMFISAFYLLYFLFTGNTGTKAEADLQNILNYGAPLSFLLLLSGLSWKLFSHPFTSTLRKMATQPGFAQYLGASDEIKQQIFSLFDTSSKSLLPKFLQKKQARQYILNIDDLDRCEQKNILPVLEAVKLVAERPDVLVFICVDKKVLLNALMRRYRRQLDDSAGTVARKFLGKIFQLSYELTDGNESDIRSFISERFYGEQQDLTSDKPETTKPSTIQNILRDDQTEEVEIDDEPEEGDTLILGTGSNAHSREITNKNNILNKNSTDRSQAIDNDKQDREDFVKPLPGEEQIFVATAEGFKCKNPRTLLRLHNTLSLIKGIYPKMVETKVQLQHAIFAVFLYEYLSDKELTFKDDEQQYPDSVQLLLKELHVELSAPELKSILYVVEKASLPNNHVILISDAE